jgi:hypothetical protein
MQLAWFHIYSENRCTSHFILLGLYFGKKKGKIKDIIQKGQLRKEKKKQGERKLTYI